MLFRFSSDSSFSKIIFKTHLYPLRRYQQGILNRQNFVSSLLTSAEVLELQPKYRAIVNCSWYADPNLQSPEFAKLRKMMIHRYGETLDLADVG